MFTDLTDICKNRNVWIQTHNFPDPDAIASAYGLHELLEHYGISSRLCYDGEIDKLSSTKMLDRLDMTMYSRHDIKTEMTENDAIILVDSQKSSGNTTDLVGDEIAAIDHHPTFTKVDYMYTDLRICGSCSSILAEYYRTLNIKPSKKAATAMIYGMRMDTLQFSRGVKEFDIEMYSYLFPFCDEELLHELESNNMEFSDLKAYGTAINNINVYGKVGFSYLDFECPDALIGILSDFILSLSEVEVVVLYANRQNGYKFSLRSERSDVHAGILAHKALCEWGSGGGHAEMAGGFVPFEKAPVGNNLFFNTVQEHFSNIIREEYPQVLM